MKYLSLLFVVSVKLLILPLWILPLRIIWAHLFAHAVSPAGLWASFCALIPKTHIHSICGNSALSILLLSHDLKHSVNTQVPAKSADLKNFLASSLEINVFKLSQCYWNIHAGISDDGTWQGDTRRLPVVLIQWLVSQAFQALVPLRLPSLPPLSTISIRCNSAHHSRLRISTTSFDFP